MKAEDALHFWNIARLHDDPVERLTAFARACEQHGIERTKAGVTHKCGGMGREPLDWSALDAEIEKENEDG